MTDKYFDKKNKFIRGPLDLHQINKFANYGINAVRLFLYMRMREGQLHSKGELKSAKEHTFIRLDNKILEAMVGVHKSNKWPNLRKLEAANLIELRKNGKGKAPEAKIICPAYH